MEFRYVAAGTIQNDTYLNRYFGISFSAPNSRFMKTSTEAHMGRLAEAVSATNNSADRYSIAIVADELSNYPGFKTIGQYLTSVTAQFGATGGKTIRGEFPYLISGVHFDGVICEIADGLDARHY